MDLTFLFGSEVFFENLRLFLVTILSFLIGAVPEENTGFEAGFKNLGGKKCTGLNGKTVERKEAEVQMLSRKV